MTLDPVVLSRIQFGFVISFHIIDALWCRVGIAKLLST